MPTQPSDIEGWLSDAQGRFLCESAAAACGRGHIVEIGSWKGRSTAWLAAGARRAGQRVVAIDPHQGSKEDPSANTLQEFLQNMQRAGVSDVVDPLVMSSSEAATALTGPIELLFIDGDHSLAAVERDAALWLPRVIEGGVVLFHDVATSGYSGPRHVFRRDVCWSPEFDSIQRVGSMAIARRTSRRTFAAAVWGTIVGALLYFYDAQGAIKRAIRSMK